MSLKQWYLDNMDKTVSAGGYTCQVIRRRKTGKQGSWERGFKFTTSVYGGLQRGNPNAPLYSFDHGRTWNRNEQRALAVRAGKTLLERHTEGELAYEAIQQINRKWDLGY
jgi:hypothetical protein